MLKPSVTPFIEFEIKERVVPQFGSLLFSFKGRTWTSSSFILILKLEFTAISILPNLPFAEKIPSLKLHSTSFVILIGFYEDLRVREASGRAPGGSPGTFSERFGGFEEVERFLEVLSGFRVVLRFSEGFKKFLEDLSPFGFRAAAVLAAPGFEKR